MPFFLWDIQSLEVFVMPSLGNSINLYLMDGLLPDGGMLPYQIGMVSAYKIPYGELKNCDDILEINSPGVYFLFGKDDDSGKPFIYVGDARKRLL